jgi:cell division protein FtsB
MPYENRDGITKLDAQATSRRNQRRPRRTEDPEQVKMKIFRDLASSLVGIAALLAFASAALAQVVSREQDIADLRLGQRILRRRIVSRRPDQGSFGCADDD